MAYPLWTEIEKKVKAAFTKGCVAEGFEPYIAAARNAAHIEAERSDIDPANWWDCRHAALAGAKAEWNKTEAREEGFGNCPRCSGRGHIREFGHVRSGTCFKCKGTGNVA